MGLIRRLAAIAVMILIVGGVGAGATQQQGSNPTTDQAATQPQGAGATPDRDARETREALDALLERHPPTVGRVLKMDPSLLGNSAYLAVYPALASFLASHPEVAHNPGYFLAGVPGPDNSWRPADPRTRSVEMANEFLQSVAVFVVFLTVTLSLAWLVRTLLDWRRWTRLARVQAEVHTKLLDRFTSNEDLLAYMQTPAGSRFLESGPLLTEAAPRGVSAPVARILWSVQLGIVLAVTGIGLMFVSGRVLPEIGEVLSLLSVLAIALGLGFVLSAVVAWIISRRMGLFEPILVRPDGNAS
jgi:hypothetical protein